MFSNVEEQAATKSEQFAVIETFILITYSVSPTSTKLFGIVKFNVWLATSSV